jgi:hypothetical protein
MTKSACFVLNLNLLTTCFFLVAAIISDIIGIKVFFKYVHYMCYIKRERNLCTGEATPPQEY